jgi:hypothetical protein
MTESPSSPRHGGETVRLPRLIAALLAGGLVLLATAILLSALPANATDRGQVPGDYGSPFVYTDHPARVSTGRTIPLYVDRDFSGYERERIVAAMRQWNYVLNGSVRMTAKLLPEDPSSAEIAQIRRSGGFIVAKVDSNHPITQQAEGRHALAVTVSRNGGGFVYVIGDRIGQRDLTGVVMHEFGHVLGAGHDSSGMMAPVYNPNSGHCIDRDAAAMVAKAQRLTLAQMNWCEPNGGYTPPMASRR